MIYQQTIKPLLLLLACLLAPGHMRAQEPSAAKAGNEKPSQLETATLGGGCFWCVEAVFENMEGVTDVVSGYAGGHIPNPSYQQVLTGRTGHAEVCQIHFDPQKVSYLKLLEVFMKTHDPTTLNRQGPDHGPQYRSVIFTHSDEQKEAAETIKRKLIEEEVFHARIVTQIVPFTGFFPAEDYHQDYYRKHPNESYCRMVVRPKIAKFKKVMAELDKQK